MSHVILGQFFEDLATQAGIEVNDDLKKIFQGADFKGQIPEAVATSFKTKLISREAVLHDKDIKNTMFGQAFGTFDTRMKQYAKAELGFSDEEYSEVRGSKDKTAIDILPDLLRKAKQKGILEAEAHSGLNVEEIRKKVKGETDAEYKARIDANARTIRELQEAVSGFGEKEKAIVQEWEGRFNGYKVENALTQKIQGFPWKKELGSLKTELQTILTKKLANDFVWKEEQGELVPFRKDDPSARAMESGKLLKADDVIKPYMVDYLEVNPGNPPARGGNGTPPPPVKRTDSPPVRRPDFSR